MKITSNSITMTLNEYHLAINSESKRWHDQYDSQLSKQMDEIEKLQTKLRTIHDEFYLKGKRITKYDADVIWEHRKHRICPNCLRFNCHCERITLYNSGLDHKVDSRMFNQRKKLRAFKVKYEAYRSIKECVALMKLRGYESIKPKDIE